MITAVDTNVLIDLFGADPTFGSSSRMAIARCQDEGRLVACEVVWAETAAQFPEPTAALAALGALGVVFDPVDQRCATAAAEAWRRYRRAGGPCSRVVADFLVGAHASARADRLLTRDRGFYRHYFDRLDVLDPST